MKSTLKTWLLSLGLMAMASTAVFAQDSALVEALVKKGILTNQEAEEIRTDLVKEYQKTGGGKIELGNHITKLKLYGDARLRYTWDQRSTQAPATDANIQQSRSRYRIRLGAEYKFTENFEGGFQLASGTPNDSANQTFGSGYGKFGINVDLLYLKYSPADWVQLIAGKQKLPFYTTDMIWDGDVNPEGATEIFTWKVNDCTTVDFIAGQYYFSDNAENNTAAAGNTDVWQFYEQAKITYKPTKDVTVLFAPGVLTYTAGSTTGVNTGSPAYLNVDGANNLNLILLPGEVKFKVCDLPVKTYWDFAWNTEGQQRVQQTYGATANTSLDDDIAWLVGVKIGDNKKKGDWSVDTNFRTVGIGSTDPNLSDADPGLGFLNQQVVKVSGTYNFTDSVTGTVSYFEGWAYKDELNVAQMGSGGPLVNADNTHLLQVDLNWKF
ncbi:MAG: putative porin [Candidatus Methylacidiphilales bacterium]